MNSLFRKKSVSQILHDIEVNEAKEGNSLQKTLRLTDLVSFGIAAIIGAGIFVLTGEVASQYAGPAITISFVIAAFACACAGLACRRH